MGAVGVRGWEIEARSRGALEISSAPAVRSRVRRKPRRAGGRRTSRATTRRRGGGFLSGSRARARVHDARRTPLVSPCDPSPLWGDPRVVFPWKCGVMSTGLGDPGPSEGSPRCTESLEKASCTSSASASASAPATANPTVRLIGCAMAIAWPDLGPDGGSASAKDARTHPTRAPIVFPFSPAARTRRDPPTTARQTRNARVDGGVTCGVTIPETRSTVPGTLGTCCYASRRSNAMIPYPLQRRIVALASSQGIQTAGLCPRRAVSISRVSRRPTRVVAVCVFFAAFAQRVHRGVVVRVVRHQEHPRLREQSPERAPLVRCPSGFDLRVARRVLRDRRLQRRTRLGFDPERDARRENETVSVSVFVRARVV